MGGWVTKGEFWDGQDFSLLGFFLSDVRIIDELKHFSRFGSRTGAG
jgi:hypothetical protein